MSPERKKRITGLFLIFFCISGAAQAGEVIPKTQTAVVVREHPQTGKPYLAIVRTDAAPRKIFYGPAAKYRQPDYRMLESGANSQSAGYDGPASSRKKVYLLAAGLAAGGVAAYAAMPAAAASGAAAGGAGVYAAAGTAVAAGTISASWVMMQSDRPDDFTHKAISRELKL